MKGFIRKDIIGLCRLRTILVSLLFFFTLFTAKAIAVDYYWTATDDGSVKNWSHSQNWSNASGNSISGYPDGTNDNAIFQDAAADVLVDVYARIGKLTTRNNFTGTINVNGNILNPTKGLGHARGTIFIHENSDFRIHGAAAYLYNGATITSQGDNSNFKVQHNLIFYSGSVINAPGPNSQFMVRGGFRNEGGTFNHNLGTLIMNTRNNWGEAMIKVTGTGSFYDLDLRGSVSKKIHTDITIDNDLFIKGNGNLLGNGKVITIKGDWWQQSGKNNFTNQNSTVIFSGSQAQNITHYSNSSSKNFNNITIDNPSGVSLLNELTGVNSTLKIESGSTLDINGHNLTASTLDNDGNLQMLGSETVSITTMDTNSGTVTYDGSGATGLAAGDNYFNLTFNQSGTSTLNANLDVNGSINIDSGTLDVSASNYSINVGADWTNNGSFIARSGSVAFDNNSNITAGGTSATKDFNNVVLSGTAGSQSDDILIGGNFTLSGTGTWYTNCNTMTINGLTTNVAGTIANTLSPTVSFNPLNGNSTHAAGDNIILTFNTAIRKADDNSDLNDTNVDSHITLKDTNESGSNIDFDATIDTENKVITVNPSSNLNSSQTVYVAIGNTVENSCDTALGASSATFTVADTVGPVLNSSNPPDGNTSVAVDANIVLTFNEAVDAENGNITIIKTSDSTVVETIDVTSGQVSGSGSTEITINPSVTLDEKTDYHLNIDTSAFDDSSSNDYIGINDATTLNFTTVDATAPTITFNPSNGETGVGRDTAITIELNEAIVNTDTSEITNSNVSNLITLKDSNASGSDITYSATISANKKIITIDPADNFTLGQTVYVALAAVEDASANETSLTSSSFTVTTSGETLVTITPTNGAVDVAASSNITIGFNTSVRLLNNNEITDSNVASLITLKQANASGADIPFIASINEAKKVITINPISNFTSGQSVYVSIGATVEDSFDNAISASSSTFTIIDNESPTFTFNPTDTETNVLVSSNITITFNESIRNINNSTLTDSNVDSLITLKDEDSGGSNISFNATIDNDKKIITINPTSNFSSEQVIYLEIAAVEDQSDNSTSVTYISFTARDSDPPILTFFPSNGAVNVLRNSDITISFDEPIRNIDDSPVTDANVDSLITLKQNNSSGSDISFDAVIDSARENITITPTSSLGLNQDVYVAIGATVEDEWDNAISATSSTFTTIDDRLTVTFDPADGETGLPLDTNVIITFSNAIRNLNDSEITNSNIDDLITLEYAYSGSPIPFDATINVAKQVVTINPTDDLIPGDIIFVSIDSVENISNVETGIASGTFSVADTTPPNVFISPSNGTTNVQVDQIITIYFDEEIRLLDNSAINNVNVDNLITVKDTNSSGADIAFDATIDIHKQLISIDLTEDLSSEQTVYVSIGSTVEDSYDNAIATTFAVFSAGDTIPPSVSIDAVITASIATNSDITFTFTEAVRNLDDSALTNSNVGSLITLKDTDANGTDLSFTATINSSKTVITIDPTNNFTSGQIIYAAIGATVEDFNNNVIPATSKTFTAEYLVEDLTNPMIDKDFVGLLKAQAETAKRFIQQTTSSILKRMEWLRRNKDKSELSHQGVSVNFSNSDLNGISNALQFSKLINQSGDLFSNNWSVWSEGNISVGEIDSDGISSLRDITTNGITLGIDNKIDDNHFLGAALRVGKDDVNVGSSDHSLDTDAYSLSFYATAPHTDKTYIDINFGVGFLEMDLIRSHASGSILGNRDAKQLYGSIVYSAELEKNDINLSPYGRIDGGYTKLSSFSEKGTIAALRYNEQTIKSAIISLGILADDEIKFNELNLNTYGRLEYGRDVSSSSNASVSYIALPNTIYSLKVEDEKSSNIRAALGTDIETPSKWFYQLDYELNYRPGSSQMNSFSVSGSYELDLESMINLSLTSEPSSYSTARIELDSRLMNGWFFNGSYEFRDREDQSSENSINLKAVRYF